MEVEKQTKQVSETAERAAMGPEGGYVGYERAAMGPEGGYVGYIGYVDLSLTREGWIRSKRRWSNFGATQGWPKTRKRNRSNDLD
ncbi:MAG: hypothetical protein DMG46_24680 [Acidobacteria bacterium]|nr:MAG: hypothetical protein DMG46_24680 [Acidobacteriota bacterium]